MRLSVRAAFHLCTASLAASGMILGATPAAAQIVINEIDYDQVGADSAEFLELKNVSGAVVNLDNYSVEFVNGNAGGAVLYDTIDLPNVNLAAGDYYVICANAATVVNCDLDDAPNTDFIQNGSPDALGLRLSGVLVDAVSYEGNSGAPYTETTGTAAADSNAVAFIGLSRFPDGTDSNNNSVDLSLRCITPGETNASASTGCTAPTAPLNLSINDVSLSEGNAGTTSFIFTVSLAAPAPAGGVTFDIATADGSAEDDNPPAEDNDYVAQSLTGQTILATASTYTFTVVVNGDSVSEPDEAFFVNVTNVLPLTVTVTDSQGLGTILNDDVALSFIHDVQGSGAATPIPGATVAVEGVVIGDYQGAAQTRGFFLQEEDADHDANPATSEGIFVFCNTCPTAVAEGQRVRVTGTVSEFFGATEITASTAGSVVVTEAGNHLAEVTPAAIDLPVAGVIDDFYEPHEGMRVTFVDTLTVSEYFELARFGQIELFEGGRPRQFTETAPPSVAGYNAHLDTLSRSRVILDDDDNSQNVSLLDPDGSQFIFHPRANGGFSVGTQGIDFFRGGDLVNGLTGVLDWSFAGVTGTDAWRIRPTAANPPTFTVANPRPVTPPAVGGAIRAVGMNLLNYFTTIDTTAGGAGPCGPGGTLDCRGADSVAELNRQRERAAIVICTLNADVYGFGELENTTPSDTITDLLGAVNARCGGANPYAFVNTGGTLGTDAIRVALIYRTGILSPVGAPLSDLDPIHSRPPTAQTFDVVDAANPAFGQRFTVIPNHLKSKGSSAGLPGDDDAGDGAGASNTTRTLQATRLLAWISSTVLPAAADLDVLLLGDFNSYAQETPITTLTGEGFTDLETALLGAAAYSYLFDGQLGHLDYALSSASLTPQVTGVGVWHINADEADLLDYNDEIRDVGEAAFEEKPDGSALVPPRVLFQPATPYRASDHDPVVVGIFPIADLAVTKTDSPDPVTAGSNLTYTVTVTNNGPDAAATASWSDTLAAGTTFVSLPAVAGWSCTTPPVGSGGTVSCSNPSFAVGSAFFTLTVAVAPSVTAGTVLSNTATAISTNGDPDPTNNSGTATTTVAAAADLAVTKVDTPDPVTAGGNIVYTITSTNGGPSNAASATLSDILPAGTTFVSLVTPAGWSCTFPPVGSGGTVACSNGAFAVGSSVFTLTVQVAPATPAGTVISNTATAGSATSDPNPGDESATATTTVAAAADLAVTKVDTPDPVTAGGNITYTITATNAGPSNAATATLSDTLPAGTTFVALASPAGWSCTTPPVGAGGTVACSNASFAIGSALFTLTAQIDPSVTAGTVISNTATASSATSDPNPGDESATATTTVAAAADLAVTKVDTPDPVTAGGNITYTITATNAGPSNAATATLSDTLPAGTTFVSLVTPAGWFCNFPPVGSGGTVSCSNPSFAVSSSVFTLTVQVAPATPAGTVISNTATASSATSDPNPGDESATATTTVAASADLAVTKVDTPDPVNAGSSLTYAITVANAGPSSAATTTLTDTLPAGTTFGSLTSPAGWICTTPAVGAGGTVSCSNAAFAPGSALLTLIVQVAPTVAGGTVLTNTATAASATADPAPGNESGSATTTVLSASGLSATKSVVTSGNPGSAVTYTVVITNAGPGVQGDNPGDEFTDTLPAELELVGASATSGTVGVDTIAGIVTWNGSLPAGGSVTIVIDATLEAGPVPGTTIANQGAIAFDADGNGTNESNAVTDDPAAGGPDDPTTFVVASPTSIVEIPALDRFGFLAMGLILSALALSLLRRARSAPPSRR